MVNYLILTGILYSMQIKLPTRNHVLKPMLLMHPSTTLKLNNYFSVEIECYITCLKPHGCDTPLRIYKVFYLKGYDYSVVSLDAFCTNKPCTFFTECFGAFSRVTNFTFVLYYPAREQGLCDRVWCPYMYIYIQVTEKNIY